MMFAMVPAGFSASLTALVSTTVLIVGRRKADPIDDLTRRVRERSRHPIWYAVTHPVETVRRIVTAYRT